jgi:hypothetical protein
MKSTARRYVINPLAITKRIWAPHIHQYVLGHANPNYLHSLWLGTGWNMYALPYRLATEILRPVFHFMIARAVLSVITLPLTVLMIFWMGITGRANAVAITREQAVNSVTLSREQSRAAMELGYTLPVTDITTLAL